MGGSRDAWQDGLPGPAGGRPTLRRKATAHVTIDIMMPFYGDPQLFRDAVASVMAQTDADWRLVVIDDVYPDTRPGEWLQSLGDPRIRYLRNETNLGVSGNFSKSVDLVENE